MNKSEILLALSKAILETEEKLAKTATFGAVPAWREAAEKDKKDKEQEKPEPREAALDEGKPDPQSVEKTATWGALLDHPQAKAALRDGKSQQEAMQAAKDAMEGKNKEADKAPNK